VLVEHRRRAHDRPTLAPRSRLPVADDLLGLDPPQREAPGQSLERERCALLVEHLEASEHVGDRRRHELGGGPEPDEARRRVVRVHERPVDVLDGDPVRNLAQDRLEVGARVEEGSVGLGHCRSVGNGP
jgi:hypothetical protein